MASEVYEEIVELFICQFIKLTKCYHSLSARPLNERLVLLFLIHRFLHSTPSTPPPVVVRRPQTGTMSAQLKEFPSVTEIYLFKHLSLSRSLFLPPSPHSFISKSVTQWMIPLATHRSRTRAKEAIRGENNPVGKYLKNPIKIKSFSASADIRSYRVMSSIPDGTSRCHSSSSDDDEDDCVRRRNNCDSKRGKVHEFISLHVQNCHGMCAKFRGIIN